MSIRYTSEQLQRRFAGPAGSPGYPRVADALRLEGRGEEAIDLCREGLKARPAVAGYVVLGKALMDTGRLEEAREEFEAALRLDPRCLSAMHALARIMDRLQWRDAAAGYYRSILDVEPWDAEIRALVEGPAPAGAPSAPAAAPAAGLAPEADTFVKPEGFDGEVLEVNINEMADAFLPAGGDLQLEPALDEAALAPGADLFPPEGRGETGSGEGLPGPQAGEDVAGGEAPPISGNDVEERLDSIFGSEGETEPSPASTWTAAPALDATDAEASSTATGLIRTEPPYGTPEPEPAHEDAPAMPAEPGIDSPDAEADGTRFEIADPGEPATEEAFPEAAAEADAQTAQAPAMETEGQGFGAAGPDAPEFGADEAAVGTGTVPAVMDPADTVHGEDIERRLDELFNLSDGDDKPKAAPVASASELPVAPSPVSGETVVLGEVVGFGDPPPIPLGRETAEASAEGEIVTGQDVADKLDSLFGPDPQAKSRPAVAPVPGAEPAAGMPSSAPGNGIQETVSDTRAYAGDTPELPDIAPMENAARFPSDGEAVLSTESMLPSAWSGDAPQVTGEDVEAQLDRLFNLEPSGTAAGSGLGNGGDTVSSMIPDAGGLSIGSAAPGEASDPFPLSGDTGFSGEGLGDTMIIPQPGPEADEPPAFAAGDIPEVPFDTLAPEAMDGISDTAAIEMVDGGDVAERLDRLFDAPAGPAPELEPEPEPFILPEPDQTDPEADPLAAGATMEVPIAVDDAAGPPAGGHAGPVPSAMPMMDEEEGYPEEEDVSGSAAGANVATVTLAEIYFQQGLREQALQIYRQLLEREPDNESVRKRIAEIEATRADADSGSAPDPRWPRPGLKVPKRKK